MGAITIACILFAGCNLHKSTPPRVKIGENLAAETPADSYPNVFVRGENVIVVASHYSYRSVYIVLNPNNAIDISHSPHKDAFIASDHTGYVSMIGTLKRAASVTIPVRKFIDNKGRPFPATTHVSQIGIVFTGGPSSGSGAFVPTSPD